MLSLPAALRDEILAHALRDHPTEACGVVAGTRTDQGEQPVRVVRMRNTSADPTLRYAFDPAEQLAQWGEMDARGEDPLVIYHSHTARAAFPSVTDVTYALEPGAHYLIVSTAVSPPDLRSYRQGDGRLIAEPLRVI